MKRQYVHLSNNIKEAEIVAKRHKGELIVLKIQAKKAFQDNINFYKEENGIWLSDLISSKYILNI